MSLKPAQGMEVFVGDFCVDILTNRLKFGDGHMGYYFVYGVLKIPTKCRVKSKIENQRVQDLEDGKDKS